MAIRRFFSKAYTSYKQAVDDAFNRRNLFYTNVLLSMGISAVGDTLEQTYELHNKDIEKFDVERTAHMAFSGCIAGVICHHCSIEMQALGVTWRKLTTTLVQSRSASNIRRIVKIAFSRKYLVYTNVTISVSLSALGDMIEQRYEIYTNEIDKFEPKRTMCMAFSGATLGLICHNGYIILDKFLIGRTWDVVIKKLLLDQMIFSPIMIVAFFGSLALFEQKPLENFKDEVTNKFITLYKAEWVVWPPAQIINFYFLPTRYRVLYDNTISLGYDVYTSQVKHQKPKIPSC